MSDRELLLQRSALAGLIKSFDSRVVDVQRRFTRWPGAASAAVLPAPFVFTPGILLAYSWQDALSIQVGRGSWFVIANVTIRSMNVTGPPAFFASMRVYGSDNASAESREYHSGSVAGQDSSLQSFSTFDNPNDSATITMQVSQTTKATSVPTVPFRPILVEAVLVARPI